MVLLEAGRVPHIWKVLRDAATTTSLMNAALTHLHPDVNLRRERFVIGVDATSALWWCLNNGYGLSTLYGRLCVLLRLPVTVVFFFDHDDPPPCSHRDVDNFPNWADHMTQGFVEFIEAFGFSWYRCIGEAAADLARLKSRGMVNVILSDDIYSLIYGADSFCTWPETIDGDETSVRTYTAAELPLSREDLILVLVLGGGKHSQDVGIGGVRLALRMHVYMLSHDLRTLALDADNLEPLALVQARADWRQDLLNAIGELGASHRILSGVPEQFPSARMLELVATYWRSNGNWLTPVPYFRGANVPNVAIVCRLLQHYVYRGPLNMVSRAHDIAQRMCNGFWAGVIMQYILLDPDTPRRLRSRVAGISMPSLLDLVQVELEGDTHEEVIIPNRWSGGVRACTTRVELAPLLDAISAECNRDVNLFSEGLGTEITVEVPFLIANRVLLAVWINHLGQNPEL